MKTLPKIFLERLKNIIPQGYLNAVLETFEVPASISVRINTLKIDRESAIRALKQAGIASACVPWFDNALILRDIDSKAAGEIDLIKKGALYRQGLSSMVVGLALAPQPNDLVLDMCAAPGSKTSQLAALMRNQGKIVAIESVRARFYKLKSVLNALDVKNVDCKLMDARRFKPRNILFDKVLVDAPCSSESRFKVAKPKTYAYWSPRKIKEMATKQRGLLLSASRLVKPKGVLVYSTCSFSPEENEGVIDWFLRKTETPFVVDSFHFIGIRTYPALKKWKDKRFSRQVEHCLRILPTKNMEGFFIAKLIRRK